MPINPSPAAHDAVDRRPRGALATGIVLWGVGGVLLFVAQGIYRLTPIALEPLRDGALTTSQACVYAAWVLLNTFLEGYRGFQRGFAPRVVTRALVLAARPRPLLVLLAPLYCMGLMHASRRRLIASWSLLLGIIAIIILVRRAPPPWRAIVDGGVVVGLTYGFVAQLVFLARGLVGRAERVAPDLPARSPLR
ncbi:MAG: hypothetical protein H6713_24620 [Myxococcales bacterium]|nr:hypothetical protein [Myxococcales bacterium]MCB9753153.1 hypothetical protein [Myxococcales bacterium]